jgi:NHL repeat
MNCTFRRLGCLAALSGVPGCGTTEVVIGEAPGVARVVAGVLGEVHEPGFPDTAGSGPATAQPIGIPSGLAAWDDGRFAFADRARRRVAMVTAAGELTWPIGRGICGFPGPGGAQADALCLDEPEGVAASDGLLFVVDHGGHRVYAVDVAGNAVSVLLGTGVPGMALDGAAASTAPTARPTAVSVGPDGAVYVAESDNHRVVRVGGDGLVSTFAGRGDAGDDGDGGPARLAALRSPAGLVWRGDTLYVSDGGSHRVRRIVADTIRAFAGLGAVGFVGDRGPAAAALFNRPGALAVTGALLFVADRGNHRVRVIRLGPDSVDTFAGTGRTVPGADLLEAGRTAIAGPTGVAAAGRVVFVSDSGGHVVRRVVR